MQLRQSMILALSSALGLGYLPKAPGTFGTLAAIPLWWVMSSLSTPLFGAVVLAVVALSVWVASAAEEIYGAHDVQKIVIDEVAGMLVAAIGVPFRWPEVVAAFLLFRLLDMTKPWPVGWLDEHVEGGLGVVADDVAAGAIALGLMYAARFACGGWW